MRGVFSGETCREIEDGRLPGGNCERNSERNEVGI